jgi:hypothetical protein
MKKILLLTLLVLSFTACTTDRFTGDDEVVKSEVMIDEKTVIFDDTSSADTASDEKVISVVDPTEGDGTPPDDDVTHGFEPGVVDSTESGESVDSDKAAESVGGSKVIDPTESFDSTATSETTIDASVSTTNE